jgi:hypothetical protein
VSSGSEWRREPSDREGSCGYIEEQTMGGSPAWGFGVVLKTAYRKKISLLQNVTEDLGAW